MEKYNRIKVVMVERDMTSKELARKLEMSRTMISRWLNNHKQPSIENFFKIAEILEVDVCDLLVREKKEKKD